MPRYKRRHAQRSAVPVANSAPAVAVTQPQALTIGHFGQSAYFATQESSSRQRLQLFEEDTRKILNSGTLSSLRLTSRTLVKNYGPAAALNYLAWIVGPLKPQSISGDPTWSELAEERFNQITSTPSLFDLGQKHNFAQAQTRTCLFHPWVDGDAASLLTASEFGNGAVAMYQGHRITNPPNPDHTWNNGVKTNRHDAPIGYWFKEPGNWKSENGLYVPASSLHFHRTIGDLDAVRAAPALAHGFNHFRDIIETNAFVKLAIKQAALMGLTRADAAGGNAPSPHGLASALNASPFTPPDYTGGVNPPSQKQQAVEDVMGGGLVSAVPLKILQDDRPHPNQQAFKESLLREIAIGFGLPPEVMYFMDAPGGADIRFKIEVLARFIINCHRDHVLPYCQRLWTYIIGKEMEEGRLPYPSKGEYWKCRWMPQRDISVDLKGMGRLFIELRKALMMSFAQYYEGLNLDYEDQLRQIAKEERMLIDLETEFKLPPGRLTEKIASASASTTSHLPEPQQAAA